MNEGNTVDGVQKKPTARERLIQALRERQARVSAIPVILDFTMQQLGLDSRMDACHELLERLPECEWYDLFRSSSEGVREREDEIRQLVKAAGAEAVEEAKEEAARLGPASGNAD